MDILVIEDDTTTVETIRMCLKIFVPSSAITVIDNGIEALRILKEQTFDGVLLDLGLPLLDGMKVLEEAVKFSQVPILIITARHDDEIKKDALKIGAKDYITKPFNYHDLLDSINKHFSK